MEESVALEKADGLAAFFADRTQKYQARQEEVMSLSDYIHLCQKDDTAYATPAQRLLKAFGEPEIVDTTHDDRLRRIFENRMIIRYPAFRDFYGMEEKIMKLAEALGSAADGMEEEKQILYLLGPVGGGKSSLAEKLKELMQQEPIYVLRAKEVRDEKGRIVREAQVSPHYESPLCLFDPDTDAEALGIPPRYLKNVRSPWANKRLKEAGGDMEKAFDIVKIYPSILDRIAIAKTEPGDDNNQDQTALVGKTDIRFMETLGQHDPDAYAYSGALNRTAQGLMEFVEMFKAPIKMLHPLLTATQERHYNGTEEIGAMPFGGIILAHSNESEWQQFRNNKSNEAFLDRVHMVKVPYCLSVDEEVKIYEKLIRNSELADSPCAPHTLRMLAEWSVMTRLKPPPVDKAIAADYVRKMQVYNGENLKGKDNHAKTMHEYRDRAGIDEGMNGASTRFAFKILSATFNYEAVPGRKDSKEANPIHLMYVLEMQIRKESFSPEVEQKYLEFLNELKGRYAGYIQKQIQQAYLESYGDYGQNMFERYVTYADFWIQDHDYRDPDTGAMLNREALEKELQKMEKPAGIGNPKDFRNEVVNFVLRAKGNNGGRMPKWTTFEKIREVIEKRMFTNMDEMLPVISFGSKKSTEDQKKHDSFVERMKVAGYTGKQTRLVVDWFARANKHS